MKWLIGNIQYCDYEGGLILASNKSTDSEGNPKIDEYIMTRAQFFARLKAMNTFAAYLQRKQAEAMIADLPKTLRRGRH